MKLRRKAFFGSSGVQHLSFSISASHASVYDIESQAPSMGWDGTSALILTLTVNPGVTVSGMKYQGAVFPRGSEVRLVNRGVIAGLGGRYGLGVDSVPGATIDTANGYPGLPGLTVSAPLVVDNTGGVIAGGGGGGGGGGSGTLTERLSSGADGNSTAMKGSHGGYGAQYPASGGVVSGSGGVFTGKAGGTYTGNHGKGGNGGAAGSAGLSGANISAVSNAYVHSLSGVGKGGAAGASVVGNSHITWIATGSRIGAVN